MWFPICSTESRTARFTGTNSIHKACSLARPLAKRFAASVESNSFWNHRINPVSCVSCNLRPGVLLVFLNCRHHTVIWVVGQCCVVVFQLQVTNFCSTNSPTSSRLSQTTCLLNLQTGLLQNNRACLCLALGQSHKHLLNVLHQSSRVPQSHATFLIHASSISSVSSSF